MVHGTYYGIQYEIFLTKAMDFFDDLLPIWMKLRVRIEMEQDKETGMYKLIVIPHKEFDKCLSKSELFWSYMGENEGIKRMQNEEYLRTQKLAMVRQYEKYIRHNANLPKPITQEEFNQLSIEKYNLEQQGVYGNMSQAEWREHDIKYNDVFHQLQIQRIIHDPDYFEEIKKLHSQLLAQIDFTEEHKELIQNIISHPKLDGIIRWHGLTLVDGFW
jgi:hypothetical protein